MRERERERESAGKSGGDAESSRKCLALRGFVSCLTVSLVINQEELVPPGFLRRPQRSLPSSDLDEYPWKAAEWPKPAEGSLERFQRDPPSILGVPTSREARKSTAE